MKTRIAFFITTIFATLLLSNCKKKEKDPQPEPTPVPVVPVLVPTVITSPIINITDTTATSGGTVTLEGASAIISVGVCWDTLPNPTTLRERTFNGAGTGNYISKLTELRVNTKYYVRAYATNGNGTAYGNEVTFNTPSYNLWTKTNVSSTYTIFACMLSEGATIYAGTYNGVIFSSDTGSTWTSKGLSGSSIQNIIRKGNSLFAVDNDTKLHRSQDNGNSWTSLNTNFPYDVQVYDIALQGSKLIAGTDSSAFISSDDGNSWTRINSGLPEVKQYYGGGAVYNTASSGSQVYAIADYFVGPGYDRALYKYDEPNNNWLPILSLYNASSVTGNKVSGNNIFIGTNYYTNQQISSIQRSKDGGDNWETINGKGGANVDVFGSHVFIGNAYGDFDLSDNSGDTFKNIKALGLPVASSTTFYSQYGKALISKYYLWMNTNKGVFKYRYN